MSRQITVSIPVAIQDKVEVSSIYENQTQAGKFSSYGVDLTLKELRQFRKLKSSDLDVLQCKIESTLESWAKAYERHRNELRRGEQCGNVDQMNQDIAKHLKALNNILKHTLDINDVVNWDSIKRNEPFRIAPQDIITGLKKAPEQIRFAADGKPMGFIKVEPGPRPMLEQVTASYGLFTRMFNKQKIQTDYEQRQVTWRKECGEVNAENERRQTLLTGLKKSFEKKREIYEKEKAADNAAIDAVRQRYQTGDPSAIEEYCDLVLTASSYPDDFPRNWELEYRSANRMLVVQMDLPAPGDMPQVENYKYVKARDAIEAKKIPESARKSLYDSVIYQTCLRTLHEMFEADIVEAIDSVAFNGAVTSVNPATGASETKIILSVSASKDEFMAINLASVDPKATFRHLKGVSAAALHGLTPIPPVIQLDKSDKRIIEGRSIDVDASINLAAMHWGDFEHLVRELFEREFAVSGGEVKVTQASSDGGVDAIAFDPDPIRGGKIVIQAKRYTNVVGVSAIRDLYGTVMNEGATKGIIVTTSDYGRDSYEFAKGKPLTLLNGSNLLAMLENHGKKARIDTAEAKKILGA